MLKNNYFYLKKKIVSLVVLIHFPLLIFQIHVLQTSLGFNGGAAPGNRALWFVRLLSKAEPFSPSVSPGHQVYWAD